MFDLAEEIARSGEVEIETLLNVVLQRYAVLYPDYEVMTISFKKSSDRNQQLDRMIELLEAQEKRSARMEAERAASKPEPKRRKGFFSRD